MHRSRCLPCVFVETEQRIVPYSVIVVMDIYKNDLVSVVHSVQGFTK